MNTPELLEVLDRRIGWLKEDAIALPQINVSKDLEALTAIRSIVAEHDMEHGVCIEQAGQLAEERAKVGRLRRALSKQEWTPAIGIALAKAEEGTKRDRRTGEG